MESTSGLNGWRFVLLATLALLLMSAFLLYPFGTGEAGMRVVIRATARTSLLLFLAAFVAAALRRFWPNRATLWLRRNRRYVGVAFAVSQAVHLLAIAQLAQITHGAALESVPWVRLLGGGLAYLFTAAMAATSFDRSAAWLGPRAWNALHTTGMYVNWGVFMFSYAKRLFSAFYYPLFALALFAAFLLRVRVASARRAVAAPQV